jgi:multiple antibiotic resistance protein
MLDTKLPLFELFMLLFTLAGPIKIIPMFHGVAQQIDAAERRKFAVNAALIAFGGIILAAIMGGAQLAKVGISREALGTAAGLVLVIIGLMPLIGIEKAPAPSQGAPGALSFAFPTILAPHTFALIILYSLYAHTQADTIGLILTSGALMALNLLAMLGSGWIMEKIGMTPLRVFGAVFGIIQLALGVEILFWGMSNGFGMSAA